ncbi:uncharacterized protein BO95DRAFT_7122 [Aspergillus brunneoviolaceus CBS 621.78]|uniref:Uncharacterized protein n=1 Tax=Aspergillus brunneoviolaceus CBS 621.78 TaxID=1450534 RepID=A0ACD1GQD3_9EURO|nr:hypothetical protein BO95DRAFT_7122 [Aspergillus brunneoviolaceus CBS 621.78]RAH51585.1 hypothetical protein BO95DRAFT_7122 [Aspergillus brunneoviolaceus CBS 621.78]
MPVKMCPHLLLTYSVFHSSSSPSLPNPVLHAVSLPPPPPAPLFPHRRQIPSYQKASNWSPIHANTADPSAQSGGERRWLCGLCIAARPPPHQSSRTCFSGKHEARDQGSSDYYILKEAGKREGSRSIL